MKKCPFFPVSHCCCSYKGKQQKGIKRKTADPVTRSSKDSKDYDAKDTKEHEKLITYLRKAGVDVTKEYWLVALLRSPESGSGGGIRLS
ncbi:hypothetical protein Dimus_008379 [Dionaea muscipula]